MDMQFYLKLVLRRLPLMTALFLLCAGLGVALGRTPLVDVALQEGRLVRPFGEEVRSMCKYWLVYEDRAAQTERIAVFLDWIKREAAEDRAGPSPHPRLHNG